MMDAFQTGKCIARQRRAAGLTQEQLAEKLGVTAKAISKWETGNSLPSPALYEPLCKQLGLTMNELFQQAESADNRSAAKDLLIDLLARRLCPPDCGLTPEAFRDAMLRFSKTAILLSAFESRREAVAYMMKETGLSMQECGDAYDMYRQMLNRRL